MASSPSVNVISKDYAYGLGQSRSLVVSVLKGAGLRCRVINARYYDEMEKPALGHPRVIQVKRFWKKIRYQSWRRRDFNIFLENIYPMLQPLAMRQLFIPNQEWMLERDLIHLQKAELVICKTRHADEIFSRLGFRTAFSSFTSRDIRLPRTGPMRRDFLCLLSKRNSAQKRVLALWARHPEWPQLTIVGKSPVMDFTPPNVRLIQHFLSDQELMRLQNDHQFHLCVTPAEGFGHKLNEGMACGAIVIATDGPPMNELITPERGLLVKYESCQPQGLGTAFQFDAADLERTIEKCLRLTAEEIERLSVNARAWFEENDRYFRDRFPQIVRDLG